MMQTVAGKRLWLLRLGSLGPIGHLPASGSIAVALGGPPLFWLMHTWPPWVYGAAILCFAAAATWLHQVGDRLLGEKDSRKLVWDELVGYLVAVAWVPFTWQLAMFAVLVERALDILKIPPAGWVERRLPGGIGVVGDDVIAGLYTCAILQLVVRFAPSWVGLSEL